MGCLSEDIQCTIKIVCLEFGREFWLKIMTYILFTEVMQMKEIAKERA